MANKFTKSVLERQAKEQRNPAPSPKPSAPSVIETTAVQTAPQPPEPPEAAATTIQVKPEQMVQSETVPVVSQPAPVKPARRTPPPLADLTAFIVPEQGRNAKNKTFYLDEAVIDGIKRAAAAQKITESKLVNDIMKKLLGL